MIKIILSMMTGFLLNSIYRNVMARHRYKATRKQAIANLKASVENRDLK